ncbi:GTPase domain-containing protein [Tessaracoccus caeni]|uniref:GTPase domain-containing protein n=1 Tax=Tessaracoccus caeni TaxID=3031239 RepID=UPI0023DC1A4C|nr:GTPase domain-containing protein [Tessaracoccus caeni]MDF1487960.1 GTPase domain-containing protein [Tessaracoccus caeni]
MASLWSRFRGRRRQPERPRRTNVAVIGATGVGKSTLINAVVGSEQASAGIGAPVTKGLWFYETPDGRLGLYDFEGAESFTELRRFVRNLSVIADERAAEGPDHAIHGYWLCLKASDRRFDDQQIELVRELAKQRCPIWLVLTQTPWRPDKGFPDDVVEFLSHLTLLRLPIVGGRPFPVAAMDDEFAGTAQYGIDALTQSALGYRPPLRK